MLPNCVSSFYITLLAHDPALDPLDKTFQVRVDEQNANCLDFTCSIARFKDEGVLFCTIVLFSFFFLVFSIKSHISFMINNVVA